MDADTSFLGSCAFGTNMISDDEKGG